MAAEAAASLEAEYVSLLQTETAQAERLEALSSGTAGAPFGN